MFCFHAHRLSKTMTHTGRRFQDESVGVFPSLLAKSNWNRIAIQLPLAMKSIEISWTMRCQMMTNVMIHETMQSFARHDCNDMQCLLLARLVHTTWDDEWLVVQSLNYITMRSLHVWHITFVHYIMWNRVGLFILDVIWHQHITVHKAWWISSLHAAQKALDWVLARSPTEVLGRSIHAISVSSGTIPMQLPWLLPMTLRELANNFDPIPYP